MTRPFDPAGAIAVLAEHAVDYVLVGGLAAVVRGSSAMTNDADIVPCRDPDNLERLSAALVQVSARLRVETDPAGIAFDPHPALIASMSTLDLTTDFGDLDLTFSPAALADYRALLDASDEYELAGAIVNVASLDDIIRSKEAADRPKDHATLPILRALRDEIGGR